MTNKTRNKWGHSYTPEEIGSRLNNVEPEEQTAEPIKNVPGWFRRVAALPNGRGPDYWESLVAEEKQKQEKVQAMHDAIEERRKTGKLWG